VAIRSTGLKNGGTGLSIGILDTVGIDDAHLATVVDSTCRDPLSCGRLVDAVGELARALIVAQVSIMQRPWLVTCEVVKT
jgi:hypothetical protein